MSNLRFKISDNHLGDLLLNLFQKSNASHQRYFVFELGKRGFFAEISTVARVAIYAHNHKLQLVLKNDEFGFRKEKGWEDYYLPFCAEYKEEMSADVAIFCSACRPVKFIKEIIAHRPDFLEIEYLKLYGFDNILFFFMNMLARPNEYIQQAYKTYSEDLKLPEDYTAVHIRRGDKVGWEDTFYPVSRYINEIVRSSFAQLPIFVMSDDYEAIIEFKNELTKRDLKNKLYTLCDPESRGFDVWALRNNKDSYNHKKVKQENDIDFTQHIHQNATVLIVETLIASKSRIFVGTFKSNVTWTIYALHQNKQYCIRMKK